MKLYLIRHGRQNSRLCNVNVDLCEEGYRQAALLGERLFPKNIQAVYSSDLLRAIETAQAANLYWNVEHMICPELREIDFGDMEGHSDTEIAVKYADFKKEQTKMERDLAYPGGECAADVVKRADPVLKQLVKTGYERVAVVTHGGLIRVMAAYYTGIPLSRFRILGKELENCSITELNWDEKNKRFTLECFNDHAHLDKYPELLRSSWKG